MLSIMHTMKKVSKRQAEENGEERNKLHIVHDYNQHMGGVDKNDAIVGNYNCVRKTYKWTTKVFMYFLEEVVFSSFVIHKKFGGNKSFLQYKLTVIRYILDDVQVTFDHQGIEENWFQGSHFPRLIPPTEKKDKP